MLGLDGDDGGEGWRDGGSSAHPLASPVSGLSMCPVQDESVLKDFLSLSAA